MSNELIISLLAIGFIGSLAAMFIFWAKLDEQKKLTQEERDNYKAALSLHNATAEAAQSIGDYLEKQLDCAANAYEDVTGMYRTMSAYSDIVKQERDALQDKLSAILCPMNDHVWELSDALRCEVRCKKCGRVQDG